MKNLFYFLIIIATLTLSSCDSKDDNPQVALIKTLKATIDGVEVTFDTFKVEKIQEKDENGNPYTDLVVTATKSTDVSKGIVFNSEFLEKGNQVCYFFSYTDEEKVFVHDIENESFIITITENSVNKIKGNFTGTIPEVDGTGSRFISHGNFEIEY